TEGRVIAYFQPHGFGPTRFLRNDLVASIAGALRKQDSVFFSEIYYAGGTVTRDISSGDLASDLKAKNVDAHFVADRSACGVEMAKFAKPGDTILVMGARDPSLSDFAKEVSKELA
ncbi:MAG: Mur ligase, partial [Fibrobacter sp.]|nr:Mur ligase [Fibrobacter sp.]